MRDFFIKMVVGMIANSFTVEEIVAAIEALKVEMQKKVKETEATWDDYALEALLRNEEQVLIFFEMAKGMVDEKVEESENTTDDALWKPLSDKLEKVIAELRKGK